MNEEFVEYAGRSEPKERLLKALPLILAAILGIPALVYAIKFSLEIGQTTKYMFDIGTSTWFTTGLVLLSLSGAFCLVFYLLFLFVGTRRRTWKWRIWWSVAAFLAAAILPIWWLFAGYFTSGPA